MKTLGRGSESGLSLGSGPPLFQSPARSSQSRGHETYAMKTISLSNAPGKLTRQDKQAAVEAMLREIQTTATDLLQEIGNVDPFQAEVLREEASRLSGIAFTLTKCLCYDDIETAYRVVTGDPDEYGDVLGVAV